MQKSDRAAQARRTLDRRFAAGDRGPLRERPRSGWIKAIRGALGMSQTDLATRLGVTPAAVAYLERSEREERISLGRLNEVASALDCTLVYALVPNTSLEDTVQRAARRQAAKTLGYVERTMDLESQGIEAAAMGDMLERETRRVIVDHGVWRAL